MSAESGSELPVTVAIDLDSLSSKHLSKCCLSSPLLGFLSVRLYQSSVWCSFPSMSPRGTLSLYVLVHVGPNVSM